MIGRIISTLSATRFPLSPESRTQAAISDALTAAGINHEREVWLNKSDRIDFLIAGTIGAEVKVKSASKMAIFRQLERYAKHRQLTALILVTNVPMGMPPEIDGMPVYVVNLAKAWL